MSVTLSHICNLGFFLCMVPLCIISLQGGDCCMTPSLLKMAALLRQPQNTVEHV